MRNAMRTDLSNLKAICPHCKYAVSLRPGFRLLKHGYRGSDAPVCPYGGMKVTEADIHAWAMDNAHRLLVRAKGAQKDRQDAEENLAAARAKEAKEEAELKTAQEILADYTTKLDARTWSIQ